MAQRIKALAIVTAMAWVAAVAQVQSLARELWHVCRPFQHGGDKYQQLR